MKRFTQSFSLALAVIAVTACDRAPSSGDGAAIRSMDEIKASGELRVLSRNAPTTYFLNRDGDPAGPDYELTKAFADYQSRES